MEDKNKKIIQLLTLSFLLIQPFFDLVWTYSSISTLIRVIIVVFLFTSTIFIYRDQKILKCFLGYWIIVFLFFILQHLKNSSDQGFVTNFYYSLFEEGLYFVKMMIPLMTIYVVYKNIVVDKKTINIISRFCLLISLSIIITNILKISYTSYLDEKIMGNIFDWFNNNSIPYTYLASKGYFYFTNHIVAILVIFLPIVNIEKQPLTTISMMLALIMLGNKISTYGSYLVLLTICFVYLFCLFVFKEKIKSKARIISYFICLLGLPFIIIYSPARERIITNEGTNLSDSITDYSHQEENSYDDIIINDNEPLNKIEFILSNHEEKRLNPIFFLYYPYELDQDFWYEILNGPEELIINYRYLEKQILSRVVDLNDNPLDFWFGISYSRNMNIVNLERDFESQIYSVGFIGLILFLLPYMLLLLSNLSKVLKGNISFENSMFLFAGLLLFLIAYLSGNIINSLSVMIPYAYILGMMTKKISNQRSDNLL